MTQPAAVSWVRPPGARSRCRKPGSVIRRPSCGGSRSLSRSRPHRAPSPAEHRSPTHARRGPSGPPRRGPASPPPGPAGGVPRGFPSLLFTSGRGCCRGRITTSTGAPLLAFRSISFPPRLCCFDPPLVPGCPSRNHHQASSSERHQTRKREEKKELRTSPWAEVTHAPPPRCCRARTPVWVRTETQRTSTRACGRGPRAELRLRRLVTQMAQGAACPYGPTHAHVRMLCAGYAVLGMTHVNIAAFLSMAFADVERYFPGTRQI